MAEKPTTATRRSEDVKPPEPRTSALKNSRSASKEPAEWRFKLAEKIGRHAFEGAFGEWVRREIDWSHLEPEQQRELLEAVRDQVGTIEVRNGAEKQFRLKFPSECERGSEQEWGATILQLGELEASVDGSPPDPAITWAHERASILVDLDALIEMEEVTQGDAEMGRESHSASAKLMLERIKFETAAMSGELDNADESGWLEDVIASVVLDAFYAGRHYQVALNKPVERDAVRHSIAGREGAAMTNTKRRGELRPKKEKALLRMDQLIRGSMSITSAAAQCSREGLGNKHTVRGWWRSKKKTD